MTIKDIDDIISVICPNDEDFEKLIISPAYLKKELEVLALEQEPCEDYISRKAVLDAISELNVVSFYEVQEDSKECYYEIRNLIKQLRPVIPQPKTDVFDKIKAEIEQEYNCLSAVRADETLELGECLGLKMSLKIIDKYKTESEENNGNNTK